MITDYLPSPENRLSAVIIPSDITVFLLAFYYENNLCGDLRMWVLWGDLEENVGSAVLDSGLSDKMSWWNSESSSLKWSSPDVVVWCFESTIISI